jgi:hypothetical protein
MHLHRASLLTFVALVLGLAWTPSAQGDVREVYDAILHGDYQAGSAELARLLEANPPGTPVLRAKGWLDSYQHVVGSRQDGPVRREDVLGVELRCSGARLRG